MKKSTQDKLFYENGQLQAEQVLMKTRLQQYEQEMADVGWKINVPSWGQVVDKQDYIIYQNEKDMQNKVGGRPIYSAVGVPGYLWGYR